MANKGIYFPIIAGILALSVAGAGCSSSDGAENQEASQAVVDSRTVQVETLVLQPEGFQDVVQITGTVEATNDATLSAQSSGTVVGLAERGTFVRAGQVVAQLDPGMARASVEQAEASVASAQANFDLAEDNLKRQQPLYRDSVISAIEFERVRAQYNQAVAQLNQAKAALAQTRQQLAYTTVVTPFAGVVEEKLVEKGEQVMPGTPVVRIVNTGDVKVTAGVPERYAGDIEIGTPVEVSFQGAGKRIGRVSFVGSAVDPNSRTFTVEIALANQDGSLKPQVVAGVLLTRERIENAVVIPRQAVIRHEDGASVYVATRSGDMVVAERREVVLGSAYGDRAVVSAGLASGDEIVVLGQNNITEGDPLQVVERHASVDATMASNRP